MSTKREFNILVTGVGAIIGYGIIESIRLSGIPCQITGVDIFEENYGRYVCDHFQVAPYTSDSGYFAWLSDICDRHHIDLIIPGIEQDLFKYSENRTLLPTLTVLNNETIINLAKDKYETFTYLSHLDGVNVIPTYMGLDFESAVNTVGLPFIVKPRKSYASKGYQCIRSVGDFRRVSQEINEDTIFQPFIGTEDEEYTFSAFGSGDGHIADQIILRRYLSREGATQRAHVVSGDDELQFYVDTLVKELKPIGPTNFQFRKHHGKAFLLEINPRISSACSLRAKFGYNEPQYCIEHYLELGVHRPQVKKTGRAIRYIADQIIYE